jgi:hypothetical protein
MDAIGLHARRMLDPIQRIYRAVDSAIGSCANLSARSTETASHICGGSWSLVQLTGASEAEEGDRVRRWVQLRLARALIARQQGADSDQQIA